MLFLLLILVLPFLFDNAINGENISVDGIDFDIISFDFSIIPSESTSYPCKY